MNNSQREADVWDTCHSRGIDHYRAGRYAEAAQAFEEAHGVAQSAGDPRKAAEALNDLGVTRRELGEWETAEAALEQARAIFSDLGDAKGQAQAIGNLASVYEGRGDHSQRDTDVQAAAEAYRQSARMFEQVGESDMAMYAWQALSRLHLDRKAWLPAIAAYEEGIESMPDRSLKKGLLRHIVRLPGKWFLGG